MDGGGQNNPADIPKMIAKNLTTTIGKAKKGGRTRPALTQPPARSPKKYFTSELMFAYNKE